VTVKTSVVIIPADPLAVAAFDEHVALAFSISIPDPDVETNPLVAVYDNFGMLFTPKLLDMKF
jgi:hypothetical protein